MSSPKEAPLRAGRSKPVDEPIAIIGIGCRYADARGPKEFFDIVDSGRNTVRDAPQHRVELGYDVDHFYDPRPRIPGKISSKKAGFLEHPELFDPAPFGIAPRDALTMDPQQRLLVEVTWDALEDAGVVPESILGERVAIILGYMAEDYSRERTGVLGEEAVFRGHDVFTVGGMSHAVLSGRIANLLGVTGPSFTLDTACSSSLIATHLACQSLRRGESKMAIAGGANLFLSPEGNIALSRSGMLSMSGACRAFDASADGFVRAEGAGVVLLRPLSDALADGNPIYAVIRGSGISTDGKDGGHMMAPGRNGQAQAMWDAYAEAGVSPADIQYVETHGTGTNIGDPVEIGALADVMGPGRDPGRPLRVASVKGNLGHTESASGVAGLINAALAIRHRRLPRQLHFETPNPAIPWDEIPIRVQAEAEDWPFDGPALVGVNSFGISGTNAHVVLESPPETRARPAVVPSTETTRPRLLPITGHESKSLHAMAEAFRDSTDDPDSAAFADLAYTLGRRRTHRAHRLAIVAGTREEMRRELDAYLEGNPFANASAGVASRDASAKLVMVFPGQGGQWLGMGRELLELEPVFTNSIDVLDAAYSKHVDWSLRAMLDGRAGVDWNERLDLLQPLLVAVEIALAELWASWGIRPDRVLGQSMGEIAAAYVAGALSLDDMARLACHRGKIVARASGKGAMAVVSAPRDEVEALLADRFDRAEVAGSNSPSTTIVSGDRDAVEAVVRDFESREVFARQLEVDFASHCFHMDPLIEDFRAGIEGIEPRATTIPFDSTVDGREIEGDALGTDYWLRNLRSAVAFDRGFASAVASGGTDFLEVSPHPALSRAISENAAKLGQPCFYASSLQREQGELRPLLQSLGEFFVRGVDVDFAAVAPEGRVVSTPLYAYQRKRYWFSERTRLDRPRPTHPLVGLRSQSSVDARIHTWDFVLDADTSGFVEDFRLAEQNTVASGIYPEIALAVAESMWPDRPNSIEGLDFTSPLVFGSSGRSLVQATLCLRSAACGELRISSREDERSAWELRAICTLRANDVVADAHVPATLDREGAEVRPVEPFFETLEDSGLLLGPKCRTLRELEVRGGATERGPILFARLMLPRVCEAEWFAYHAHPALLESCFQLVGSLFDAPAAIRPVAAGRIRVPLGLGSDCWCRIERSRTRTSADSVSTIVEADLSFFDREGTCLGSIDSLQVEALPKRVGAGAIPSNELFELQWVTSDLVAESLAPESAVREVQRFIVISDSEHEASAFAAELRKEGVSSTFCEKAEDLAPLTERMRSTEGGVWGLILLAWRNRSNEGEPEPRTHRDFRVGTWARAIREHCSDASQFWIATRGLQTVGVEDPEANELAPLIAREAETFASCVDLQQCRLFDASAGLEHGERVALAARVGASGAERQFAARGKDIYVPRLVSPTADERSGRSETVEAGVRNFRAVHAGREGRDCVALEEVPEPELCADQVEISVRSAALGQSDVLMGLGLARGPVRGPRAVGLDFAGVVTAVGDPDSGYRVGDPVMGVYPGALARRIAVPVSSIARKPSFFDWNEAACLPHPHLVAQYALQVVARLRAGERVLLLSAGGGVGHAMVTVARSIGAEVSATASTDARRRLLRELGATVIGDSSTMPPNQEGADFDVVVAAESGQLLHDSLSKLAPGGRYLDLCPRNDFVRPELGALRLAANRSISALDVGAMMSTEPTLVSALLDGTAASAAEGRILPPAMTVFSLAEAGRALRFMAQNRHVGRVCVDLGDTTSARIRVESKPETELATAGYFIVSGSEPEIQRAVGESLRRGGASDVVLTTSEGLALAIDERTDGRRASWIHVTSESVRGSDEIERMMPALRAEGMDHQILVSVRPPLCGESVADRAWETRTWIDRLMLPQSVARRSSATLSVGHDLDPNRVAELVELAMGRPPSVSPLVAFSDRDLGERLSDSEEPLFERLERRDARRGRRQLVVAEFLELPLPERRVTMEAFVRDSLAGVLALSEEQRDAIELSRRIDEVGLDSLMTLELFLGLGRDLGLEIGADWFETPPSLSEIAAVLVEKLDEKAVEA